MNHLSIVQRASLLCRALLFCCIALGFGIFAGCSGACEESCPPLLVVRGIPESGNFPDGTIQIEVQLGETTTQCTITLPDDLGTVPCGPLRVTHARAQVCEDEVVEDVTVVRCSEAGAWSQGIFIDEPTEEVSVHEVFPDGSEWEQTFTPEYETADPERISCSDCPRTEVSWDLP